MPNPRLALRCCVLGAFILLAVGGAFDLLFPGALPQDLRNADHAYAASQSLAATSMWLFGCGALVGLSFIVGGLGLLFFKPWSRPLALWSTIVAAALYPFINNGIVLSGWSMSCYLLAESLWGAALALAYASDARSHFNMAANNRWRGP
jgi:hypothetical protein